MEDTTNIDEQSMNTNWNRTASDYARHRRGFPPTLFARLEHRGWIPRSKARTVDLGTGTGAVALALAERGHEVVGVDVAEAPLAEAALKPGGMGVSWRCAAAEDTALPAGQADVVMAGQCWHWFDRAGAAAEVMRLLRPAGDVVIAHLDWLPRPGNVVEATVDVLERHGARPPAFMVLQTRSFYPHWPDDLLDAGFVDVETFSFDVALPYSRDAWRGRVRASAWLGASRLDDEVRRTDAALAKMLDGLDEDLVVPHRIFVVHGRKPSSQGAA